MNRTDALVGAVGGQRTMTGAVELALAVPTGLGGVIPPPYRQPNQISWIGAAERAQQRHPQFPDGFKLALAKSLCSGLAHTVGR
jgi:hypothetical protein